MKNVLWAVGAVIAVVIVIMAVKALNPKTPLLVGKSTCQASDAVKTIELSGGDSPAAYPDSACVDSGETITWTSPTGGSWSVSFKEPQVLTAVNGESTTNAFQPVKPSSPTAIGTTQDQGTGTLTDDPDYCEEHFYRITYQEPSQPSHTSVKPMKIIIMPTGSSKQWFHRFLHEVEFWRR